MTRGAAGSARRPRRRLASEGPPRPAQADGTLRVARERRAGSAASSLLVPIATKMPHRAPAPTDAACPDYRGTFCSTFVRPRQS